MLVAWRESLPRQDNKAIAVAVLRALVRVVRVFRDKTLPLSGRPGFVAEDGLKGHGCGHGQSIWSRPLPVVLVEYAFCYEVTA